MSTGQRLPEDIAAEQAYLADLRTQQEAAERQRAEARRQELAALGLLDSPAPPRDVLAPASPAAPVETAAVPSAPAPPAVRSSATPASLTPEALAALPPEVRQLVEEALARQQADNAAAPGVLPPVAETPPAALPANTADVFAAPATTAPVPAAPQPTAKRELTEEEIERLEKVVLGEVQVNLADKGSVLVSGKAQSLVQRVGSTIDNVLGLILGRKTW